MGSRSGLRRLTAVAAVLVALGALGCARAPSHRPEEFVGKWASQQTKEQMLDFRSDGLGQSKLAWYPHDQSVRWLLSGDKLVISDAGTGEATQYDYRFDGPDTLTITTDGKSSTFVRMKESPPEAKEPSAERKQSPAEPK